MGKKFVGLDGLKHFWTKAKTWITGQITAEVTAKIAEIVANAPEDLDTLKEIADWIKNHANSAAEMNTQIIKNQDDIKLLQNKTVESCPVDVVESGNMHAVTSNAVAIITGSKVGFLSVSSTDIIAAFSMVGIPNDFYAKTIKQFCDTIDSYNSGVHSLSIGGPAYGFTLWKHTNEYFVIDVLSYSDYADNIVRVRKVGNIYTVYRYVR